MTNFSSKKIIPHSKTTLDQRDRQAVMDTLANGRITAGVITRNFQEKVGEYLGKEYVRLCSSGTMALYTILSALEVKPEDEVLLPTYVCPSVYHAVKRSGAQPVLYDNDRQSWLSSFEKISTRVTRQTRAIIVVHTFGIYFRDMEKLKSLNVPIIEDCAHAFTPTINGKPISQGSLCSFYSFNATKLLAVGEGGAAATDDRYFAGKLRESALDSGLSDLNCALGISQLNRYRSFLERRAEIANLYFEKLGPIAHDIKQYDSIYFRFPIFVEDDSPFFNSHVLFKKGVDSLVHHRLNMNKSPFMNAEEVFNKTISIPIYPSLQPGEIDEIIDETQKLYAQTQ